MVDVQKRKAQLAQLNRAMEDRPIPPHDPRYFPFHQQAGSPRGLDPIKKLRSAIELRELDEPGSSTSQVFSGFRGTGKSTELLRLKAELEQDGYQVLFVEGAAHVNLFKPDVGQAPEAVGEQAQGDALSGAGVAVIMTKPPSAMPTSTRWMKESTAAVV